MPDINTDFSFAALPLIAAAQFGGSPYAISIAGRPIYAHILDRLGAKGRPRVSVTDALLLADAAAMTELDERSEILTPDSDETAPVFFPGGAAASPNLRLEYPWDLFDLVAEIAGNSKSRVSPEASIEENVEIRGNVQIEAGAVILAGARIKGNVFIGRDCFIGNDVLIRGNTCLEAGSAVGFAAEIKSSLISAGGQIGPMSAVPDCLLAPKAFLGGLARISNTYPDGKNVNFKFDGGLVDTGRRHFGAIIGQGSVLAGSVRVSPGRHIGAHSFVGPGVNVVRNVPENVSIEVEQTLRIERHD